MEKRAQTRHQELEATLKSRFLASGGTDLEWVRVKSLVLEDALIRETLDPTPQPEPKKIPAPLPRSRYMDLDHNCGNGEDMMPIKQDATLATKIRTLADWSLKFRTGVETLVNEGLDPDELDASIAEAEERLKGPLRACANRRAPTACDGGGWPIGSAASPRARADLRR